MPEVYLIPRLNYLPKVGSFAKIGGDYQGQWYTCREEFHWVNANTRRFLFVHQHDTGKNIANFVKKAEKKLELDDLSYIVPTQYATVSLIRMSPWWRLSIRRSLFTALLRAGQHYTGSFNKALFSPDFFKNNYYTADTEPAVKRFFRGYTQYTGGIQGWWDAFMLGADEPIISKVELEKLLVKPE